MSSRIQDTFAVRIPTGVSLHPLFEPENPTALSPNVLTNIAVIADRVHRVGHVTRNRFGIYCDIDALYSGTKLVQELCLNFMLNRDYYLIPQDFSETLLPEEFRRVLRKTISDYEEEFPPDSDTQTTEVDVSDTAMVRSNDYENAKLILGMIPRIVELYNKINQMVSMYSTGSVQEDAEFVDFVFAIKNFESKLVDIIPHFEDQELYVHPARYMAGWSSNEFNGNAQHFFEDNLNEPAEKKKGISFNKNIAELLSVFRDLGASLLFYSNLPRKAVRAVHKYHYDFNQFIPINPNVDFAENFVHCADLYTFTGSTLPYYQENISPSSSREHNLRRIGKIMPVPLSIIKDPSDVNLAIRTIIAQQGYACFLAESAQVAFETFVPAITASRNFTEQQKARCLFAKTY